MRKTFTQTLTKLAQKDKNIYLLTGDLGFSFFESFAEQFPKRFLNCGVAEENMMAIAAGLALSGKKPYVYSIIPFVTMRCFEQIRNDICYQNLDVKLVGVGAGFAYGPLGATHYAIEDIAILRALPNMSIISPADPVETKELVLKTYQTKNPTYLRLGRGEEKVIYDFEPKLEIGKPSVVKEGKDGVIIATGVQVGICKEVTERLKKSSYDFKLISLHTLKPIDKTALLKEVKEMERVFTVEEHNIIGGLGSAVAEILAESSYKGDFKRIGIPDEYPSEIGKAEYLRRKYKLDGEQITEYILNRIKKT